MVPHPYIHYALILAQMLFFVVWIGFLLFHISILAPLSGKLGGESKINFTSSIYAKEAASIRFSGVAVILCGILASMYPHYTLTGFLSILGFNRITISTVLALTALLIAGEAGLFNTMSKYRKIADRVLREPIGFIPAHLSALDRKITMLAAAEAVIAILSFSALFVAFS